MARGLSKRKVDKVIEDCFWEGFQGGLGGREPNWLEYASTSGLYAYNGVRRIAEREGYLLAQKVLRDHVERLGKKDRGEFIGFGPGFEYKIPGRVYAECYGEARIAAVKS